EMNDQSLQTRQMPFVPEYWQHDLHVSWFPNERSPVSLGVKNLTDAQITDPVVAASHRPSPHLTAHTASINNGAAYMDPIGRYYFVTFKATVWCAGACCASPASSPPPACSRRQVARSRRTGVTRTRPASCAILPGSWSSPTAVAW